MVGIPLNEPIIPEEVHEPKGRRGRPRKTQESEPGPMLIDKELKRTKTKIPGDLPQKRNPNNNKGLKY